MKILISMIAILLLCGGCTSLAKNPSVIAIDGAGMYLGPQGVILGSIKIIRAGNHDNVMIKTDVEMSADGQTELSTGSHVTADGLEGLKAISTQ